MSEPRDVVSLIQTVPYAQFIGVRFEIFGDEMTAILPYAERNIGNPTLPALHGGLVGAFMEITALAQLMIAEPQVRQPRTVDVSIDYLRSGRPITTYARAHINRVGRRMANVQVEAWQEERARPIAALRGHFTLTPQDM